MCSRRNPRLNLSNGETPTESPSNGETSTESPSNGEILKALNPGTHFSQLQKALNPGTHFSQLQKALKCQMNVVEITPSLFEIPKSATCSLLEAPKSTIHETEAKVLSVLAEFLASVSISGSSF